MKLQVKDNVEYQPTLYGAHTNDEEKEFHLYLVHPWSEKYQRQVHPVYVLAEDEMAASSQANCVFDIEMEDSNFDRSYIERIPFAIRGWGSRLF